MKRLLPFFYYLWLFIQGSITHKNTDQKLPGFISDNYAFTPIGYACADVDSVSVDAFWMSKYEIPSGIVCKKRE